MRFTEWMDLHHAKDRLVRDAWSEFSLSVTAAIMAIYGEEVGMSEEQEELMKLVARTIRYHLKQDSEVEVSDFDARNVAGHLLLIVPEWRELLREAAGKGPTF